MPFEAGLQEQAERILSEQKSPLVVKSIQEFLGLNLPPTEYLLTPWLPKQGIAMIHAKRGIGKTHVSLGIAHAVASGGSFLGWQAPKPEGVLFLDGEMPANTIQARLAEIVSTSESEISAPLLIQTPDLQRKDLPQFNLADPEQQGYLDNHLENIQLIIIDNIATVCRTGKENDSESWLPVQAWALQQRAAGRSVLFIHHSGKSGNQRGSSAREDILDTVLGLTRPADYKPEEGARFEVHYEKARGFTGDDAAPFEAKLFTDIHGGLIWTCIPLEESRDKQVIELHREGLLMRDIAEILGVHKSTVSRRLNRLEKEGKA